MTHLVLTNLCFKISKKNLFKEPTKKRDRKDVFTYTNCRIAALKKCNLDYKTSLGLGLRRKKENFLFCCSFERLQKIINMGLEYFYLYITINFSNISS